MVQKLLPHFSTIPAGWTATGLVFEPLFGRSILPPGVGKPGPEATIGIGQPGVSRGQQAVWGRLPCLWLRHLPRPGASAPGDGEGSRPRGGRQPGLIMHIGGRTRLWL